MRHFLCCTTWPEYIFLFWKWGLPPWLNSLRDTTWCPWPSPGAAHPAQGSESLTTARINPWVALRQTMSTCTGQKPTVRGEGGRAERLCSSCSSQTQKIPQWRCTLANSHRDKHAPATAGGTWVFGQWEPRFGSVFTPTSIRLSAHLCRAELRSRLADTWRGTCQKTFCSFQGHNSQPYRAPCASLWLTVQAPQRANSWETERKPPDHSTLGSAQQVPFGFANNL